MHAAHTIRKFITFKEELIGNNSLKEIFIMRHFYILKEKCYCGGANLLSQKMIKKIKLP